MNKFKLAILLSLIGNQVGFSGEKFMVGAAVKPITLQSQVKSVVFIREKIQSPAVVVDKTEQVISDITDINLEIQQLLQQLPTDEKDQQQPVYVSQLHHLYSNIQALQVTNRTLTSRLTTKEGKNQQLEQEVNKLQRQISGMQKHIDNMKGKKTNPQQLNEKGLQKKIQELQQLNEQQRQMYRQENQMHEQQMDDLLRQNNIQKSQLQQQIDDLPNQKRIQELQQQLQQAEEQLNQVKEPPVHEGNHPLGQVQRVGNELSQSNEKDTLSIVQQVLLTSKDTEIQQLRQVNGQRQVLLTNRDSEIQQLQQLNGQQQVLLASKDSENQKLQNVNMLLLAKLANKTTENQELQEVNGQLQVQLFHGTNLQQLKQQIETLFHETQIVYQRNNKLQRENIRLQNIATFIKDQYL